MKRTLYLILTACALVGLNSCEKVNPNGLTKEEQAFLEDDAIACVISSLTGEKATEFDGKTFKATYGEVLDQANATERSMMVESAASGEVLFRAISGGSPLISKTGDGMELDLSARKFGKLTFHKGSGANVGYVDVDIRCIPGLSKISYKTEEQWGENSVFDPVYKYGDLVKGADDDYYVVVMEESGSLPGFMARMLPGRGDDVNYFNADEKWGPWLPNVNLSLFYDLYPCLQNERQVSAISGMVAELFCKSSSTLTASGHKQRILDLTGRKVFPEVALFNGTSEFVTGNYEGFATTREGYAHYLGDVGTPVKAVKIIYSCQARGGRNAVMYVRLSADSRDERPDSGYFFYSNAEEFNKGFYENGTVAVYTLDYQAFCRSSWYGEKVDY